MIYHCFIFLQSCDLMSAKSKYISSAFLLLLTSVMVKVIGAVYKIPLTSFTGAVGRGYFAAAYNLCIPIHAVTMGAFPVALSHMVSKYNAGGKAHMLLSVKKGSDKLFFIVGLVGMGIMILLAVPYSRLIVGAPGSIYTILVLAPSILFSSMAASYRGYYEGLMNMVPTAVSQTIEAVSKMVFGIIFAKYSMAYFYSEYQKTGELFGNVIKNEREALSVIYPFTSAFAMAGVVIGALVSLIFVRCYHIVKRDKTLKYDNLAVKDANREMLSFAFPIMISSAVQSVFQFLDTASIQYSLGKINPDVLSSQYAECFRLANVADSDITTYVYGLFSAGLDFKNLVPGITMALGVCAVPAISREFELKNKLRLEQLTNDILKYTVLLSCFGGLGLSLCSNEILGLFYGSASPDIAVGCKDLVVLFGLTVPVYSVAGTAVFSVQAIGSPEKSITPYVVSGIIRFVLNIILIKTLVLNGAVLSGFIGYLVMSIWNIAVLKKYAGIKVYFSSTFIKPVVVFAITYFVSKYFYSCISDFNSIFINLIIKAGVLSIVFFVSCFSLKLLKIKEVFFRCKAKNMV